MSLDNIQLPSIVIADLFKDSLITLNKETASGAIPPEMKLSFLGDNGKNVTVVVNDPNALFLPDDNLQFLLGILGACKLSMADIALLNKNSNAGLDYKILKQELKPEKVLLFGLTPSDLQLPLEFPAYQLQNYDGQVYLLAPNLQQLEMDKAEKLKLWACLKQLFSI